MDRWAVGLGMVTPQRCLEVVKPPVAPHGAASSGPQRSCRLAGPSPHPKCRNVLGRLDGQVLQVEWQVWIWWGQQHSNSVPAWGAFLQVLMVKITHP